MSKEVPRVEITKDLCKGCQYCVQECSKQVIEMSDTFNMLGYKYAMYKGEGCIGCGLCFYACPEPGAICVYKKEKKAKEKSNA